MALDGNTVKAGTLPDPETISYRVKYEILLVYGISKPNPDTLADNALLGNFNFNTYQWMALADALNKFITKFQPEHTISLRALESTATVKDCVNLVMEKIK